LPVPVAARPNTWVCGRSLAESCVRISPAARMSICCECLLSGKGFCDELIARPQESYRLWCVVVCDLETLRMRRPWSLLCRSATGKRKEDLDFMLYEVDVQSVKTLVAEIRLGKEFQESGLRSGNAFLLWFRRQMLRLSSSLLAILVDVFVAVLCLPRKV